MPVVMGIAVVVVFVASVLVALGHGGGLSAERSDYPEPDPGLLSATDVALLRLPTGLWGYNTQATDEAFELIAESIRERDVRIVALEQLVFDLSKAPVPPASSPHGTARHRGEPPDHAATARSPAGDPWPVGFGTAAGSSSPGPLGQLAPLGSPGPPGPPGQSHD